MMRFVPKSAPLLSMGLFLSTHLGEFSCIRPFIVTRNIPADPLATRQNGKIDEMDGMFHT